jgi:NAD(P)-dependent dehydrogenase (short-subunit alcohol dehydrogenase family)
MRLKDKIVLVTGSAGGIGQAIARRCLVEGAKVMLHDRPGTSAEAALQAVDAQGTNQAAFQPADLSDPKACGELIKAVVASFGDIHILVNNAAVMTRGNLETTDAELFDRVIAVNLRAPLLLIRAALPYFRQAKGSTVLNIGSVNGHCGEQNQLAYSVAKGGLMTLTRNLADAHGVDHIRVNLLNPGWVLTPNEYALKIKEGLKPDWPTAVGPAVAPFGRLLSPEEVAHFAMAFISDEAGIVSGSIVDLEQYPLIGRNPAKNADRA